MVAPLGADAGWPCGRLRATPYDTPQFAQSGAAPPGSTPLEPRDLAQTPASSAGSAAEPVRREQHDGASLEAQPAAAREVRERLVDRLA
jgi:hypothetical protein